MSFRFSYIGLAILALTMVSAVRAEEAYWRSRPGGLASIGYRFPKEPAGKHQVGYYNLDFFFKINKDPGNSLGNYTIPAEVKARDTTLGYYWANQFGFVGGSKNGFDGYIGLQTVGPIFTADPKHRQDARKNRFVKKTRIAIFSIWNALDAKPADGKSYAAPFGHEGKGWSCKVEYPWREGVTYTIRVWQLGDAKKPNEPEWWRGSIIDQSTGKETVIGDIQVPAAWGWLKRDASMFTEYYTSTVKQSVGDADEGRPKPRVCMVMPKAEVMVAPPQANGGSVRATRLTVRNYGKCVSVSMWKTASGRLLKSGQVVNESVRNLTGKLDRNP